MNLGLAQYVVQKTIQNKAQSGFSLVEMSVVIAMMAVMATFGLDMTATFMQRAAHDNTHEEMDEIVAALQKHVLQMGYLPCPASPTVAHTNIGFGGQNCGGGGVVAASTGSLDVYIGTVPIRQLNLPLGAMADAWDRKYTYAVTQGLTGTAGNYAANNGELRILSGNRSSVSAMYRLTEPIDRGAYILISHGMDGFGAYPFRGTAIEKPCAPNISWNTAPQEDNCDHVAGGSGADAVFFDSPYNTGEVEFNYTDDLVRWEAK